MIRKWMRNWFFEGKDPLNQSADHNPRLERLANACDSLQGRVRASEDIYVAMKGRLQAAENAAAAANSRSERLETRLGALETSHAANTEATRQLQERADRAQRLHRRQFSPTEPDGSPEK